MNPAELMRAIGVIREANGLTQSNVRATLCDALCDAFPQPEDGSYKPSPWLVDVIGDDSTGYIVYQLSGQLWACAYTITQNGEARSTVLALSTAVEVLPRTAYDTDAGTTIESAKAKKAEAKESQVAEAGEISEVMQESASSGSNKRIRIKIIAAGKGSSAFYPKEVLQRDIPKIYPIGTKMYWDHPTAAEEASRPEGSLTLLAGVTTTTPVWDEAGPAGPGSYAYADVYPDYAPQVEAKGKDIGVSIRAYGEGYQDKNTGFTLKNFTRGVSIDFVTLPGAGGAVLTEAARAKQQQERKDEMTPEEIKALVATQVTEATNGMQATIATQSTAITAANTRATLAEAKLAIGEGLRLTRLPEKARARVTDAILAKALPMTEAGELDAVKFGESITAAIKAEGEYLSQVGGSPVHGMGESTVVEGDAGEALKRSGEIATRMVEGQGAAGKSFASGFAQGRG